MTAPGPALTLTVGPTTYAVEGFADPFGPMAAILDGLRGCADTEDPTMDRLRDHVAQATGVGIQGEIDGALRRFRPDPPEIDEAAEGDEDASLKSALADVLADTCASSQDALTAMAEGRAPACGEDADGPGPHEVAPPMARDADTIAQGLIDPRGERYQSSAPILEDSTATEFLQDEGASRADLTEQEEIVEAVAEGPEPDAEVEAVDRVELMTDERRSTLSDDVASYTEQELPDGAEPDESGDGDHLATAVGARPDDETVGDAGEDRGPIRIAGPKSDTAIDDTDPSDSDREGRTATITPRRAVAQARSARPDHDRPESTTSDRDARPVRPRRAVRKEAPAASNLAAGMDDFATYAGERDAVEAPDVLTAAATFHADRLGAPNFSRRRLLRIASHVREGLASTEGRQAFDALLDTGRIRKVGRGTFTLAATDAPDASAPTAE